MTKQQKQKQLKIKIDEKVGDGVYSNIALTTFNAAEFIIDFGRNLPGLKEAKILSRIVMTPQHAKKLLMVLENSINKYEKKFGDLKLPEKPDKKDIGFK